MRFLLTASSVLPFLFVINAQSDQGLSTWAKNDPVITIINMSDKPHAYDVETDSQAPPGTFGSCTGCIKVPARTTIRFHPGPRFNGAMTANHHRGTRHELNFLANPGNCWYDDDMERGMSDETLGPTDHRKQPDGSSSLVGEADPLAKANAAWKHTPANTQRALLATGYFQGTVGGPLSKISMDLHAGPDVVSWLQLDAGFDAYVAVGSASVHGKTAADAAADRKVRTVSTTKMTITIYA